MPRFRRAWTPKSCAWTGDEGVAPSAGSQTDSRANELADQSTETQAFPRDFKLAIRPGWVLAGLTALGLALLVLERTEWQARWAGLALWTASTIALTASLWPRAIPHRERLPDGERILVAGITLGALIVRLVSPAAFPSGVHVDEAAMGLVARDILDGTGPHPFGFGFIGDPAPFMYAEALMMAVLGADIGSLRVLAAVAGTATVPALWWFARPLLGANVAVVAAALLAGSASHIHFSRMALNIIEIPLFGCLALGLAWYGFAWGRPHLHLGAGMALGLGQYANFGARSFLLALGATYAALWIQHPRKTSTLAKAGVTTGIGLLIALLPQLAYVRNEPSQLWDRLQYRSVFRRWEQATEIHQTSDPIWVMVGQFKINFMAFLTVPDRGPFYGFAQVPLLDSVLAVLLLIGLAVMLARPVSARHAPALSWMAATILAGALSAGSPQFHRLLPAVPAACVIAALGLVKTVATARGLRSWVGRKVAALSTAGWRLCPIPRHTAAIAVVTWVTADGIYEVFRRQAALLPWQPATYWARWSGATAQGGPALLVAAPDLSASDERIRFFARGLPVADAPNPSLDIPRHVAHADRATVALLPRLEEWEPLIEHLLPRARRTVLHSPHGDPILIQFVVDGGLAPRPDGYGLARVLRVGEEPPTSSVVDPTVAFREASRLSDGRPFRARWAGWLAADRQGTYRFNIYSDGAVGLRIGDRLVAEGRTAPEPRSVQGEIWLEAGSHAIELHYAYIRGPGYIEMRWRPPDGIRSIVPPNRLTPALN
ncbi:MAG: glycosyltransferase family 39 protein [Chloroflexota bacterium]